MGRTYRVVAAVDEIAHEDVGGVGDVAPAGEELEEVEELCEWVEGRWVGGWVIGLVFPMGGWMEGLCTYLPVDVAADGDGAADWLYVALLDHDLLHLCVYV